MELFVEVIDSVQLYLGRFVGFLVRSRSLGNVNVRDIYYWTHMQIGMVKKDLTTICEFEMIKRTWLLYLDWND